MRNRNIKYLFFFLLLLVPIFLFVTLFTSIYRIDKTAITENTDCSYHVVIVGRSENLSFLNQVYQGASEASKIYDALVDLYVPSSKAEDLNLKDLVDYASFINADGIIAYVDADSPVFDQPTTIYDEEIPIVTLGTFNPAIPQISFLGNNYSELGRELAIQTISELGESGHIIITGLDKNNSSNYSTLMNSLQLYLRQNSSIEYEVINSEILANEIELSRILTNPENPVNVVVCLTEDETIAIAQALTLRSGINNIKLIGFGENETISFYLRKGIITKLIAVDPIKTGSQAMKELFEYRNNGYTNSYVNAPLIIKTGGSL